MVAKKLHHQFFISSVIDGLEKERDTIANIIIRDHVAKRSEQFIGTEPSKIMIRKELEGSDCYIGIFDKKWGTVPKKDNPENLSITALEYYTAKELGLPVLILVSRDKNKDKELKDFLKNIGRYEDGENWNRYQDLGELGSIIGTQLNDLIVKISKKPKKSFLDITPILIEHNKKFNIAKYQIAGMYEKPQHFDDIFKKLLKKNSWIIGERGIGKSTFLRMITEKLEDNGKLCLFLRAEEIIAKESVQNVTQDEFGLTLDKLIKILIKENDLFIIIDSVEAIARTVSWTSFSVELMNLQRNPKIHTILSVRKSDYHAFPNQFKSEWGDEINLEGFTISQVKKILKKLKIIKKIDVELYPILQKPFYLDLLSVLMIKGKLKQFSTITNQYHFLQEHYNRVVRNNEQTRDLADQKVLLLHKIADKMLEKKQFKIHNGDFPSTLAFDSIRSDGIIVDNDSFIEFFHQVYFDFIMSLKIIQHGKIVSFLSDGSEFFLRSTIYFTLAFLRVIDNPEFISNAENILTSKKISFYWKRLTLQFFAGIVDISNEDKKIIETNLISDTSLQASFLDYLNESKNPSWYPQLETSLFKKWVSDNTFQHGTALANYIKIGMNGR